MRTPTLATLSGILLGFSTTLGHPVFTAVMAALGGMGAVYAHLRRDPLKEVTDAVLQDAHRAAVALHDVAGAAALAEELEARRARL